MPSQKPKSRVAETIRKQAQSAATRDYALSLPQYRVADAVPSYMQDMLKRLEQAEKRHKA